ncbi:MAG TPA: TlpA disulfide reductase family protein [Vicinamibacterales bacterium]|nr:TlpA disulfide reductase family protein [Vicinamibacterales bacterium]
MKILLALLAASAVTLPLGSAAPAAPNINGLWDATIVAGGVEVPFHFEIATNGKDAQGFFFEGDRKVGSTSGSVSDTGVSFEYDLLNTRLDLEIKGDELVGTYRNNRPNARAQEVKMHRFVAVTASAEGVPQVDGYWEMRRVPSEINAPRDTRTWNVFLRQSGAEVSGSVLRVDGDVGTLVGQWANGKLTLSHFAGERPTLFEATPNADGTLAVTFNGNAHYIVMRSSQARAQGIPDPPDPSRYTNVKDPTAPFAFSFPDAMTGKMVSNTDPQFRGKVVILAIGGSWCPNCHDEAPFLGELYRDFHAKGLEIVGLMFENDPDPKNYRPRVQAFIKRFNIQYPMLYAGTTSPTPQSKTIAEALPQLVNFGAYPTSIYLGRDGKVRSVHAGFASPATGAEHVRLKKELRELTEQLLAEPAAATAAR